MSVKMPPPCQLVHWASAQWVGRNVAGFLPVSLCLLNQQWEASLIIVGSHCISGSCFSRDFCNEVIAQLLSVI